MSFAVRENPWSSWVLTNATVTLTYEKTSTTAFLNSFHLLQRLTLLVFTWIKYNLLHFDYHWAITQTVLPPTILNRSLHLGKSKKLITSITHLIKNQFHSFQVLWVWFHWKALIQVPGVIILVIWDIFMIRLYYISTLWEVEEAKEEVVQRHILSFPITIFQPQSGHFDKYKINNSTDCLIYFMALSHGRCPLCCCWHLCKHYSN